MSAGPTFLLLFLLAEIIHAEEVSSIDEFFERKKLTKAMLKGYDRFQVPAESSSKPVNVTITLWPYDILQVSEAKSSILFSGWLDLRWIDHSFQWKPEDHLNISHLVIPASQLWVPAVDIVYSKDESRAKDCTDCYVRVEHTGETLWGQYFSFSFPCTINVKYFPFDMQYCDMELANWHLDDRMMDLYPRDSALALDLSVFLPNVEWELVNVTVTRKRAFFTYGYFPSLAYRLHIKRKPFYYVTNLVIPTLIITLTAVIGLHFPSSGAALHQEKVQMGVTAVLSTFILQLGIADKLPRTNDVVPLIGIYYSCMVMILSLSIVSSGLIIYVEKQGIYGQSIPDWLQLTLLMRRQPNQQTKEPKRCETSNGTCVAENDVDHGSRGRHLLASFRNYGTIVPAEVIPKRDFPKACDCNAAYRYFPVTNGANDEVWRKQSTQQHVKRSGGKATEVDGTPQKATPIKTEIPTTDASKSFDKTLAEIRALLTILEKRHGERERKERIRHDWSALADVVERLSLVFFVSCAILCLYMFFSHDWWY